MFLSVLSAYYFPAEWSCNNKENLIPDIQAAVEEGIVVGGGSALLRLASKVDAIKETLDNYEQQVWTMVAYCFCPLKRKEIQMVNCAHAVVFLFKF